MTDPNPMQHMRRMKAVLQSPSALQDSSVRPRNSTKDKNW